MGDRLLEGWIVVPNWGRFQHYGKRTPIWVKNYVALVSNADYRGLTLAERGLLHGIWMLYSATYGQLNAKMLPSYLGDRVRIKHLASLNHAGFIDIVASKPLSLRYQNASPEVEKRREELEPLTPREVGQEPNNHEPKANPRALGTNPRAVAQNDKEQAHHELLVEAVRVAQNWNGKDSLAFDEELDQLQADYRAQLTFVERDDLWDKAFKR